MKTIAMILAATLALSFAQDKQGADEKQIQKLVDELGSASYETREKASQDLKKIGTRAIPALEKATRSNDPEVAQRAAEILKEIRRDDYKKKKEQERKERWKVLGQSNIFIQTPQFSARINNGKVTVEMDGEKYEADSVEEFKEKYPEVYDKTLKNYSFSFGIPDMDSPFKDFDEEFGQLHQRLRKMQEQLQKRFKRFFDQPFEPFDFDDLQESFEDKLDELLNQFKLPDADEEEDEETRPMPRKPTGPQLGILFGNLTDEIRKTNKIEESESGVVVSSLKEESPLYRLGLRKGDILLKLNGKPCEKKWDIRKIMREILEKDQTITVDVVRKAERITLTARVKDIVK